MEASQPYGAHVVAAATGARRRTTTPSPPPSIALASHVVLGSKSSTRRAILTEMGVSVPRSLPRTSTRRPSAWTTPEELVLALADAKADAIVARLRTDSSTIKSPIDDALLITADQVVVHEGGHRRAEI